MNGMIKCKNKIWNMNMRNIYRRIIVILKFIWKCILYILSISSIAIFILLSLPLLFSFFEYIGISFNEILCIDKIPFRKRLTFSSEFSITSIVEIIALCAVAWQIKATRRNLFIDNDLKIANSLSVYISEIISSLENTDVLIEKGKISDTTCRKLIIEVLVQLDEKKQDEKKLIDCLNRYKTEDILYIYNWTEDIKTYGNIVITNHKKIKK
jgi:hypothetical protein